MGYAFKFSHNNPKNFKKIEKMSNTEQDFVI
ncbi:hypothetical protein BSNT_08902 [Bacillus subtilis subsp. natto BEST195]|nr:hypothetical protein BSNT_08902 [Bacillus subtilis subsp. natto BEST195]